MMLRRLGPPPGRPTHWLSFSSFVQRTAERRAVTSEWARWRQRYGAAVRIATWNVNSVKQRVPRLLPWLDERRPDVVCLQETKLADDAFGALLGTELERRGYAVALHGEAQWN